jgi:beta-galactosidase
VRGGGTLVCGFFTGVADVDDRIREGGVDERLRRLLGIARVHEWWPLAEEERVGLSDGAHGTVWSEDLELADDAEAADAEGGRAEVIAAYATGPLAGRPAVTRATAAGAAGAAWYVSTLPERPALRALLAEAARTAGATPVLPGAPAGCEAVRRGELLFLLNHLPEQITVPLQGPHTDLLSGQTHPAELTLGRHGVAVLTPTPKGSRA